MIPAIYATGIKSSILRYAASPFFIGAAG